MERRRWEFGYRPLLLHLPVHLFTSSTSQDLFFALVLPCLGEIVFHHTPFLRVYRLEAAGRSSAFVHNLRGRVRINGIAGRFSGTQWFLRATAEVFSVVFGKFRFDGPISPV